MAKKKKAGNTRGYSTISIPKKSEAKEVKDELFIEENEKRNSSSVKNEEENASQYVSQTLAENAKGESNENHKEIDEQELSNYSHALSMATKKSENDTRKKELHKNNPAVGKLVLSKKQEIDLFQWYKERQNDHVPVYEPWKSISELKIVYLRLQILGFENDDIEDIIERCPFADFDSILEWVCLAFPISKLPDGFTDKFEHDALDGNIQTTKQDEQHDYVDEKEEFDLAFYEKETYNKHSNLNDHSSEINFNKRWILERAAEKSDDDQSSTYSDTPKKASREELEAKLQDLTIQASKAKSSGEKSKLKGIGREIGKLKQLLGSETTVNLSDSVSKKSDIILRDASDGDDFNLFFNEDALFNTNEILENNLSIIRIREMNSGSGWSGMTPLELLQECVSKHFTGSDIKYSISNPVASGYQCSVSISHTSHKFEMDEIVSSQYDAKLYVATKALYSLTRKEASLAARLPPAFSQLYKEWIDSEKNAAKVEQNQKMERLNHFAEKIMHLRAANVEKYHIPINIVDQPNEALRNCRLDKNTMKKLLSLQEWKVCTNNQFLEQRNELPVFQKHDDIIKLINQNQVVVISSETGSGKSTQIPTFLLQSAIESNSNHFNLVCTQPRKISAVSLASRVSQEIGFKKRRIIGYQVKNDSTVSEDTLITFCTTGLLLRRMVSDPLLESVTHIVIDECHERTLDSDFLLLLMKKLLHHRPDLKVVLMSATANSDSFASYFQSVCESKYVPTISIPGRSFPVTPVFLQDIVMKTKYLPKHDSEYLIKSAPDIIRSASSVKVSGRGGKKHNVRITWREAVESESDFDDESQTQDLDYNDSLERKAIKIMNRINPKKINYELISLLVGYIYKENPANCSSGSCIIFLPGVREINQLSEILKNDFEANSQNNASLLILPLHGGLPNDEQSKVFEPAADGIMKVVLSTNVAETGVTIPDVVYVIDTLRAREIRHDTKKGISRLADTLIAKANAFQRRGRAGRVIAGIAYHLIPLEQFELLPDQQTPEMQRLPLEEICLKMKMTMRNMNDPLQSLFDQMLDPPCTTNVALAINSLQFTEALDDQEQLTTLGEILGYLPVDIKVGKLLLIGVWLGCIDTALTIASLLTSGKHPFRFPSSNIQEAKLAHKMFHRDDSDIMSWVAAYNEWEKLWLDGKSQTSVRLFCQLRFLNFDVLLSVYETRMQLLESLISLGLPIANLPKYVPKYPSFKIKFSSFFNEYSQDSIMNNILYSIGLYPNVIFKSAGKFGADGVLHLSRARNQNLNIKLHGNSMIDLKSISSDYFAFNSIQMKKMTSNSKSICYLYDLNISRAIVYPMLAAKSLQYKALEGIFNLDDGEFLMGCVPRSAAIVKQLRFYLKDSFLKFLGSISSSTLANMCNDLCETRQLIRNTWFPTFLRDELTTYLNAMWQFDLPLGLGQALHILPAYQVCGEILKKKLKKLNQNQVVDICSGAGGPIPKMATAFFNQKEHGSEENREAFFTLTDLYPNLSCASILPPNGPVKYITSPIDACSLPKDLSQKFRTSFGSFHHLPVQVARAIFQDIVGSGCGIGIFEATGRDAFSIIGSILFIPMLCAYLTVFDIRPVTIRRIFFFFILPIMPILLIIDGTLSNLRTYEHDDYMEVLASVEGALELYEWEYIRIPVIDLKTSWIYRFAVGKYFADLIGRLFLIRVLTGIPKSHSNQEFIEITLDR